MYAISDNMVQCTPQGQQECLPNHPHPGNGQAFTVLFLPVQGPGYQCSEEDFEAGNSLTANSVLAGEKLLLFGRYIQDFYVGIVQ